MSWSSSSRSYVTVGSQQAEVVDKGCNVAIALFGGQNLVCGVARNVALIDTGVPVGRELGTGATVGATLGGGASASVCVILGAGTPLVMMFIEVR
jgi:hypothetical protein